MPHVGRSYPYLFEFWQAECFFWPGFVPRKLHVSCSLGYGSAWDLLAGGVVTDVGVAGWFLAGDPRWHYADPGGAFTVDVLMHMVAPLPDKRYSISVHMSLPPAIGILSYGEVFSPQYSFGGWTFVYADYLPPYSFGVPPPFAIRPATWSEV